MNIMILSASRKVGLVRAFQQALAREGGGLVLAVDASPLSPALYLADAHCVVPPLEAADYFAVIKNLCRQYDIRLVVPTRDEELPFYARRKQELARLGAAVMVAEDDTIAVCQDKKKFISFCLHNGFDIPATWFPENLPSVPNFPLFVKPRFGKGSKHTFLAGSPKELALALEQVPEAIIQEYIQVPEYTIDLFADFSGRIISAIPRRRVRIVAGESYVSQTFKNKTLIREAIRLARRLQLIGHNTIQCFFDQKRTMFIEVNPRFGGAAQLGFAAGAPTPLFLVKLLKGEKLEPMLYRFRDRYVMLRYTEDLFIGEESLAKYTPL